MRLYPRPLSATLFGLIFSAGPAFAADDEFEADAPAPRGAVLKLGLEATGALYGSDSMGGGGGIRLDAVYGRWVFGGSLGGRYGLGTPRPEGRVRLRWVELEGSARWTAFSLSASEFRFGVSLAPMLVFPEGIPSTRAFQSDRGVNAAIALRAIGEVDLAVGETQSVLTRVAFGAPPLGFLATLENGRPIGGLAEWELIFSVAWLWQL